MTTSLDLTLLPLVRHDGVDQPELPGLYATEAPRRAARGRSGERLIIHLALVGTAPLSPKGHVKLREHLVDLYFKTTGSSTSAMRTVAEWLNEYLLERNRRGASRSMQAMGVLTLAVMRGNRLYVTQSGPAHTFLATRTEVQHVHDPNTTGIGLGSGRVAPIHYHQSSISPDDVILITANPPLTWKDEFLQSLRGNSIGNLHRKLIQSAGGNVEAAAVQIEEGKGNIQILRPEPAAPEQDISQEMTPPDVPRPWKTATPSPQTSSAGEAVKLPPPAPRQVPPPGTQTIKKPAPAVVSTAPAAPETSVPESKPERDPVLGPALQKIGEAFGNALKQGGKTLGALTKSMLPDESLFTGVPTSTMAFIAVAVPILVVVAAAWMYFDRGQAQLYQENFLLAQYEFDQAQKLENTNDLRVGWNRVLAYLDKAESYQVTSDSQAMRAYVVSVIDSLDRITRLAFQPAIAGNLPVSTRISRIVVADDDKELYLLTDAGSVLRATLTDKGYVVSDNFLCGPVHQQDSLIVEELVDIAALPPGNPDNATIVGIDANGTLLYCIPGGQVSLAFSLPPPDMNWGEPTALTLDGNDLYVLDPVTNAVWIYRGVDGYAEQPELFFDSEVPLMGNVIDLAVMGTDLFLLHEDGQITTCTYGIPTRCDADVVIRDINTGEDAGYLVESAAFSEIQMVTSPSMSLYLLDSNAKAIFHLSKRLGYYEQYRSQSQLSNLAVTAFSVSNQNRAFMAIGNQVYFAQLP